MKCALIISSTSGFLPKFELDNVCILQSMGYEVHYASNLSEADSRYKQDLLDEMSVVCHNIDIARSPYMLRMNLRAWQQIRMLIKSEKIQLIHCHTPVGGMLGRLSVLFLSNKPKVIYTAHGFHFYKSAPLINNIVFYTVERFLALFSDAIILINQEDYNKALRFRLKKGGRVYRIPGVGVDLERFCLSAEVDRERSRQELNIPSDAFFLLSIGELNRNKNHMIVLRVIKMLKEKKLLPTGFCYGLCGEGFFEERLRKEISRIGISDIVTVFGYCDDVRKYIAAADYMVFPSRREGLGMAALESLAMGTPVIAADNRGTREYMRPMENGFVFSWNNEDELLEAILQAFSLKSDDKKQMQKNCRETSLGFDKKITHRIMMNIYEEIDRKMNL